MSSRTKKDSKRTKWGAIGLLALLVGGTFLFSFFRKGVEVATDSIVAVGEATQQVVTKTSQGMTATKRFAQQKGVEYNTPDSLVAFSLRTQRACAILTGTDWMTIGFFLSLVLFALSGLLHLFGFINNRWKYAFFFTSFFFIARSLFIATRYYSEYGLKRVLNETFFRFWSFLGSCFYES